MIEESGKVPEAGATRRVAAAVGADQSTEVDHVRPCDTAAEVGPEATTAKTGAVLEAGHTRAIAKAHRTERNCSTSRGAGPETAVERMLSLENPAVIRGRGHQQMLVCFWSGSTLVGTSSTSSRKTMFVELISWA